MKTGTLNQYLCLIAATRSDLITRRHTARQTWHTISQCLADGGYPGRLLATFPAVGPLRHHTQSTLTQWWAGFHAWLRTLTARERRCLSREIVLLPSEPPHSQKLQKLRKTTRPTSRRSADFHFSPICRPMPVPTEV